MRRVSLGVLTAVLTLSLLLVPGTVAQEATPEPATGLADLGLPTLDITVTADAYEGIPESLEAGRYLVTVTASEEAGEFGGGVSFIQPPDMSGEEFIELLRQFQGPPDESGVGAAAATPIEGPAAAASPAAEGDAPPAFFFESRFAGGNYAGAGQSAQVVLDLTPGEWVAWGDEPSAPWEPVAFEVTGEMPADLPEPEAGAVMTMGEYFIDVTEGELTTGSQVIRIDNVGAQPHFVGWVQVTEGLTADQLEATLDAELEAEMTGTPVVYTDFNPDEDILAEIVFTGTQSTGTSIWVPVHNVEAGTHVLVCFFPDQGDGIPHVYHGMYTIVEVSE